MLKPLWKSDSLNRKRDLSSNTLRRWLKVRMNTEEQERERYVSREELLKAHYRLEEKVDGDPARLRKLARFINYTYDKYVHGAYLTSMELYKGQEHSMNMPRR